MKRILRVKPIENHYSNLTFELFIDILMQITRFDSVLCEEFIRDTYLFIGLKIVANGPTFCRKLDKYGSQTIYNSIAKILISKIAIISRYHKKWPRECTSYPFGSGHAEIYFCILYTYVFRLQRTQFYTKLQKGNRL